LIGPMNLIEIIINVLQLY